MTVQVWAIALTSISLSAFAQLLMKIGMAGARSASLTGKALFVAVAVNPYVVGGFAAYGIGAVLWLIVLSRTELSLAYPLVSLGFIMVALLSWFFLGEHIPLARIGGILLIVAGVALMGWAAG